MVSLGMSAKIIVVVIVMVFVYSLIIGAVNSSKEYYTGESGGIVDGDEVYTYTEFQDFVDAMNMNMRELQYNGWEVGEENRDKRIKIGPVFHLNYKAPEIPFNGRNTIAEPDTFQSLWNQYVAGGDAWKMIYEYWDYGSMDYINESDDVYLYPHIYYNSPGFYKVNPNNLPKWLFILPATALPSSTAGTWKAQFITVTGYDATRGEMFTDYIDESVSTGFAVSIMNEFYAGTMTHHDLLYVIDVCIVKEEGLLEIIQGMISQGMTLQQIADITDAHLAVAERYKGRISGEGGSPDTYYMLNDIVAPHDVGDYDGWEMLRESVKYLAPPDGTPEFISAIHYAFFIGAIGSVIAFVIARYGILLLRGA